jgi:monomeric isocitrate dehydrogenase
MYADLCAQQCAVNCSLKCSAHCVQALTFSFRVFCNLNCRAHDRNIIQKVNTYLKDHDTKGLDITIG